MAKRAGPSISVKMILTSTLLVLLTVVGFGVPNVMNIRDVYDHAARSQVKLYRDDIDSKAASNTQLIAAAMIEFLASSQDQSIKTVIDYIGTKDPSLKQVYVLDANKGVITYCIVEEGKCSSGGYPEG